MAFVKIAMKNGTAKHIAETIQWFIIVAATGGIIFAGSHKGELVTGDEKVSIYHFDDEVSLMELIDKHNLHEHLSIYKE